MRKCESKRVRELELSKLTCVDESKWKFLYYNNTFEEVTRKQVLEYTTKLQRSGLYGGEVV